MVLVFDIGATNTRLALASNNKLGRVLRLETDRSAAGFAKFLGAAEDLVAGRRIKAVAGGFPGQLDEEGVVTYATNLPEWIDLEMHKRLKALFDRPVYLSNDVVMNGLGEAHAGAGSTSGVMAYFTVSTGINAARMVDGRVDQTIEHYEIGQQLMAWNDTENRTLESVAGGRALEASRGKPPKQIEDPVIWREVEQGLARGIYNTMLHWTPEMVVLGGSMMRDINLGHLRAELARLPRVPSALPRLERAVLGDEAGLCGALAWLAQMGKR